MSVRSTLSDRRLWTLLLGTLLTLGMAWALKSPCSGASWDGFQYQQFCYNDIHPLYFYRHMDERVMPYVGNGDTALDADGHPFGFNEYPVLTGLLMYLASLVSNDANEFFFWNSMLLSLFALGTTIVLFHAVGDKRFVAAWAAAPPLILYAFHNWDLLAIFLGTLGLVQFTHGKFWQSGAALALGASAKLYPGFFLPILGLAILRRERRLGPDSWRFGLGAVGGLAAVNLPFILIDAQLWWATYEFHLDRTPNFETIWYVLGHYGRQWNQGWMEETAAQDTVGLVATLGFALLVVGLCVQVWRQKIPPIPAALGALIAFLLFNKVYSTQYTLWLFPFFVLLRIPRSSLLAIIVADTITYLAIFTFLLHIGDSNSGAYYDKVALGVLLRTVVLVSLLVAIARGGFRAAPAPGTETSTPPPGASSPAQRAPEHT